MRMVDLIEKKADGNALSDAEIRFMVSGYVDGSIPDYQMSAMMMAIVQRDMTAAETAALTMAMMHSGDVVDLSDIPGIKVDKHSTGGVGDTTTLVIAPLVAACGGHVAKMSGRGLGHTGGTLDKLESIPGVCIEQPLCAFKDMVLKDGIAVIGQSGNLVPADKKMYALRDVTATVRSVPLIAASIMSKKLAAGADAILLDVKTGSGAFCRTKAEADRLAQLMAGIGGILDRPVEALVTDMNQPLGRAIGNALEVREAVQLLSGMIDKTDPLYVVCMRLGVMMMLLSELAKDEQEAEALLANAIDSGAGLAKLRTLILSLGGDGAFIDPVRIEQLCATKRRLPLTLQKCGTIAAMETSHLGTAAQLLGAGRAKKEDAIDPAVGILMEKRLGETIEKDEPFCMLYVNDDTNLSQAIDWIRNAVTVE